MAKGLSKHWRTKTKSVHSEELMEPGESITIRTFFSDDIKQQVLSSSVEQIRKEDGTVATRATLDRLRATKRELAVVGWTLKDEEGADLAFDQDTLLHGLPPALADWLDAQIDEAWDGLGRPVASPEEAARLEEEQKVNRSTFQRHRDGNDAGRRVDMEPDDSQGAGDRPVRRPTPAKAQTNA